MSANTSAVIGTTTTTTNTKPTYYSKKPWGIHNQNQRCPTHLNY